MKDRKVRKKSRSDKKRPSSEVAKEKKFAVNSKILLGILVIIWLALFARFLFSGNMLMGTDMIQHGYFDRSFLANALKSGYYPLWEPYLHGGMPFIDAMHGVIFYPTVIFNLILPVHYALGLSMVLHVLLAGIFMFLFLVKIKVSKIISFIGALSYMLAPFLVSFIYGGHDAKMFIIGLLPLALYVLQIALEKKRLYAYLLFGLVYMLMVISSHMQLAYFASWLLGAYFVYHQVRAFVKKEAGLGATLKQVAMFLFSVIILIGVAAPQILPPTVYLGEYSQRRQHDESGYDYSTSWSLHFPEMVSKVNHEFAGTSVKKNTYWSKNVFKLNSDYAGLLPIFIGILGLIFSVRPQKWLFLGAAIFSAIFALGANTPFFYIFYYLIPQVNKFRAPSMIIFIFGFSMIMLMAFGFEAISDPKKREKIDPRHFNLFILITAGIVLLGAIITSIGGIGIVKLFEPGISGQKLQAAQLGVEHFTRTAWINTFLLFVVLGICWLWFNDKIKQALAIGIIAIIVIFDLWRVNNDYIQVIEPERIYGKRPVVDFLLERQEKEQPFRVFIMPETFGQMDDTYLGNFGIEEVSFSALHGNQMIWYDQFVGRLQRPPNLVHPAFWNILNARYVLTRSRLPEEWEEFLIPMGMHGDVAVYQNPQALPRAAVFEGFDVADNPMKIIEGLKMGILDYQRTVFLEEDPGIPLPRKPDSLLAVYPAEVYDNETPNSYRVRANAPNGGILFISESWYPAWKCYKNGEELPVLRANFAFRGIPLPPGQHDLEFRYESEILRRSIMISIVSAILALALGIGSVLISKKSSKTKDD